MKEENGLELLLACARSRMDDGSRERLRAAVPGVRDWGALTARAKRHALLPLLGHHLDQVPGGLPAEGRAVVEEARGESRLSMVLLQETVRLVTFFAGRSLKAVPFKGPVLGEVAYGNAALRPPGDVDLLLRRQSIPAAKKALMEHGYRSQPPFPPHLEDEYLRHYYAYNMVGDENSVMVDLHWEMGRAFFPPALGIMGYEGRLERLSLQGTEIPVLSAEDHLLLLSLHGARHRWERILWVVDIMEIAIGGGSMDWDLVCREGERISATRAVATGLVLARDLLGANLPEGSSLLLQRTPAALPLAAEVRRAYREAEGRAPLARAARKGLFQVRSLESGRDRLRFCVLWALSPNLNDWLWLKMPESLRILYVFLRPFRIVLHYGRRLFSAN